MLFLTLLKDLERFKSNGTGLKSFISESITVNLKRARGICDARQEDAEELMMMMMMKVIVTLRPRVLLIVVWNRNAEFTDFELAVIV